MYTRTCKMLVQPLGQSNNPSSDHENIHRSLSPFLNNKAHTTTPNASCMENAADLSIPHQARQQSKANPKP